MIQTSVFQIRLFLTVDFIWQIIDTHLPIIEIQTNSFRILKHYDFYGKSPR